MIFNSNFSYVDIILTFISIFFSFCKIKMTMISNFDIAKKWVVENNGSNLFIFSRKNSHSRFFELNIV